MAFREGGTKPTTADGLMTRRANGIRCDELRLSGADMAWWRDAKFGMFIHWGLYAIPAKGEWHMHFGKVPAAEYARLADEFVPQHFDAAEWVRTAQASGMRYMVLTARHHDGFGLWDSPSSYGGFCSARTAAHRDFVAEYVRACHDAGMRCGLYYSPMDWRFPAYFRAKELPENAALMKAQCHGQVEELMTGYGRIDVLWYDGAWLAHQGTDADAAWFWEPLELNRMVRRHQPDVVISPRSGWEGDFQCDEGGAGVTGPIASCPWEKCLNLNQPSWGYNAMQDLMSRDEVVRMLVNVVGRGGNMLLNVGPDRDGVIPPAHVERLREIGAWLDRFGDSIYGTKPGPFEPVDDVYVSTNRATCVYVHVLEFGEGETLTLPPLLRKVTASRLLAADAVPYVQTDAAVEVTVPRAARQIPCTVIELALDRPA
jgi:alpha-L-fucosidase